MLSAALLKRIAEFAKKNFPEEKSGEHRKELIDKIVAWESSKLVDLCFRKWQEENGNE